MLPTVPVQPIRLEAYRDQAGEEAVSRLEEAAGPFAGARILNVNSTAFGGGVAELLFTHVGLLQDLGIDATWQVLEGSDDFFQVIHILQRSQFRHTPSFLGLKYSDDLILLEVTFIAGRPKEKRAALLKAFNEGVVAAAGISPDDLMIMLYELPGENISFGQGLAQRAHISKEAAST